MREELESQNATGRRNNKRFNSSCYCKHVVYAYIQQGGQRNGRKRNRRRAMDCPRRISLFFLQILDIVRRKYKSGTGEMMNMLYINVLCLRGFRQDCPRGVLERETLEQMYSSFLPGGQWKLFVDQLFRVFDKDSDGNIDFMVRYLHFL